MDIMPLKAGDRIGICAPASHFDQEKFQQGVRHLKSLGFEVFFEESIYSSHRYLAGTDQQRLESLVNLLSDPEIKAIFFARGGFGSMRLLPYLEEYKAQFHPKIICGYSDMTALFLFFRKQLKWPCFYGPVVSGEISHDMDETPKKSLHKLLHQPHESWTYHIESHQILKDGQASGVIEGGCLSIICSLQGTIYEIDLNEKIFFFEDINEKPYQIDRMLTQLKIAGKFNNIRGVLCGSLNHPEVKSDYYIEVIDDIFSEYNIPIIHNLPFGHVKNQEVLPLGFTSSFSTHDQSLNIQTA